MINSEDEHQEFGSIAFVLAKNQLFRKALENLNKMSHPLMNPLFLDEAECSTPVNELLANDFLSELNVPNEIIENTSPQNSNDLRVSIHKAMSDAHFEEEVIDRLTNYLFKNDNSTTDAGDIFFLAAKNANENARKYGFPSYSTFCSLVSEDKFNHKRRIYDINFSTDTLIKNIEVNPLMLCDTPANSYVKLLKKYCQSPNTPGNHKRLIEISIKTRKNIAQMFTHQPHTLSLNDFAHNDLPLNRLVTRQKVSLIRNAENKRELPLSKIDIYTCFLCPATTDVMTNSETHEDLLKTPSLKKVNINRLVAHEGSSVFFNHVLKEHLTLLSHTKCYKVIPCRECLQKYILDPTDETLIENAFVCCSDCGTDHFLIKHKNNDTLIMLYLSLEEEFRFHKLAKEILQKYLFTKCIACGTLFQTQDKLHEHEENCFSSFVSLSSGYGRPLSHDLFFTTEFLSTQECQLNKEHAIVQISQIVKSLTIPAPTLAKSAKNAKARLLVPFSPPTQSQSTLTHPKQSTVKNKTNLKNKSRNKGETKNKKTNIQNLDNVYSHHVLTFSCDTPSSSSPLPVDCDDDDDDEYVDISDDEEIGVKRLPFAPEFPSHIRQKSESFHSEERIWREAAEHENIARVQMFSFGSTNDTHVANGNEIDRPPLKKKRSSFFSPSCL